MVMTVGLGLCPGGLASSNAAAPPPPAQRIPILTYHRFDPTTPGSTTVTIATFRAQLAWLTGHGYRIVPLHDALDQLEGRTPAATSLEAVITIDDGHRSVYTILYPLIRHYQLPVTLFIYPSAISRASYALTWEQIRAMAASGLVDVGSHTYWHPNFEVERRRLSAARFQTFVDFQLRQSKAELEARLGRPVTMLAWPFGLVGPDLETRAHDAGYRAAFAYAGGAAGPRPDPFSVPRIPIGNGDVGTRLEALIRPSASARRP